MNKKALLYISLFIVMIGLTFAIWKYFDDRKPEEKPDNIKFSEDYTRVGEDNIFVYEDIKEIISILESGTGVVFLGFPSCEWCQYYAVYLNEVCKEVGINKIYYYDIWEDRANNTNNYQRIVELLKDYLDKNDEGDSRVFVPDITFVKEGKIIGHDNETSTISGNITPEDYWTTEKAENLKSKLKNYGAIVNSNTCNTCN